MQLRQLQYFVAAAEDCNFSRAAQRLSIAQSALSRRIQALEEDLGFALFFRDRKRVHLTPAGADFLAASRKLLDDFAMAQRRAQRIATGKDRKIVIGLNPVAAFNAQIMETLTDFHSAYAEVDTELLTMASSAQIVALREQKIDVGFVHLPGETPDLRSVEVCSGRLMIAINTSHFLATKPHLRLVDFKDEPFLWVREPETMFAHDLALEAFRTSGFEPNIVHRVSSLDASLALVSAGAGHSLAHSLATAHESCNVTFRTPEDLDLSLPLMLAWNGALPHPFLARLIGLLGRNA